MFQKKNFILTLTLAAGTFLFTCAQINPGQWREMLPYNVFKKIIPVGTKLYCPTDYSVLVYDRNDESVSKLSKINTLTDVGISVAAYSVSKNCFIIGYQSSNVDVLKDKTIINFPDIKNKLGISNKEILNISVIGNYAYLCCSFGIVVLDLDRMEIKDTYYIGNGIANYKVYDICLHGSEFYAATQNGIFSAQADNSFLSNFSNWTKITSLPDPDSVYNTVRSFAGNLYAVKSGSVNTLYIYNGTTWTAPLNTMNGAFGINALDVQNNLLMLVNNIPVKASAKKPYSSDRNLLHISFEAGILEDPWMDAFAPKNKEMFQLSVDPEDAPDKAEYATLEFEKGICVGVNGKKLSPLGVMQILNKIGGKHGVGRVDMVENRYVGMKSRGVYETPGGAILHFAHRQMETITMDREVMHLRDSLIPRYAELVYYGYWFAPERLALQALVTESQKDVTGTVRVKLYKGNIMVAGRKSPVSLYNPHIATMEADPTKAYDQGDATGFIRLNGLRLRVAAQVHPQKQD